MIPNRWKHKIHVPNHQPVIYLNNKDGFLWIHRDTRVHSNSLFYVIMRPINHGNLGGITPFPVPATPKSSIHWINPYFFDFYG